MNNRRKLFVGMLVLLVVAMSCDIPFIGQFLSPTAMPTLYVIPTQVPQLTLAAMPTATTAPTKLSFPTATVKSLSTTAPTTPPTGSVDLSKAKLLLTDMPKGYTQLTEQDQKDMGLTKEMLAASFAGTFSRAQPSNFTVFMNSTPATFNIVLSLIFSPLTVIEKGAFDLELADPATAQKNFASGFGSNVIILPSAKNIGDASIGFTFSTQSGSQTMKGEVVMSRRDTVVQMTMIMYPSTAKPGITSDPLARLLDGRIKTALGIK